MLRLGVGHGPVYAEETGGLLGQQKRGRVVVVAVVCGFLPVLIAIFLSARGQPSSPHVPAKREAIWYTPNYGGDPPRGLQADPEAVKRARQEAEREAERLRHAIWNTPQYNDDYRAPSKADAARALELRQGEQDATDPLEGLDDLLGDGRSFPE